MGKKTGRVHFRFKQLSGTDEQSLFNKLISKIRYKVERTFGSMQRWFDAGKDGCIGIEKMHTQQLIEANDHNLYRDHRIAISICVG